MYKRQIEDAAKKAGCSVEDIDALETGRKGLDLTLDVYKRQVIS